MRDVTGKTAFITGGASGMGLAMARSFAAAGMKVVIADIEQAALDAVTREFEASNAQFLTVALDVTDREGFVSAADAAQERFGNVHVVCNNAGVALSGAIDKMTYKDWDWLTSVNYDGVVNGIVTFVDRIKAHGEGGHFVNTASMAGHVALPGMSVYTATKYAVVGISETMRADLLAHDIGVSVLCPGIVNTNIFDASRNRPEEFAGDDAAEALLSDVPPEQRAARLDELRASALDPAIVGDMVLHAIREDEFYIFTHPEIEAMTDARKAEMVDAFEYWREYRAERDL
ncbi:MAG: SDR family NAD(P)-dependent oxidoreductase [Gammaproteobacteria bacterium]|nr:SDR family NAD(P)-dependent oxidoreductase [Gammaproteobacteria bacterium]